MKFKKIVIVEPVLLNEPSKKELKNYCQELVSFDVPTLDQKKILERIQDADCILVSSRTVISKEVIYYMLCFVVLIMERNFVKWISML